ncbi:MAG: hypothetical protein ACTSYU_05930 [Promethearchaeota archaeon]
MILVFFVIGDGRNALAENISAHQGLIGFGSFYERLLWLKQILIIIMSVEFYSVLKYCDGSIIWIG